MDFSKIIIQALDEKPEFQSNYFYRELLNAINENYSEDEFYQKTKTILNNINNILNEPYYKNLDKLNDYLIKYDEGKYFIENDKIKTKQFIEQFEKQTESQKESISMPIHLIFKNSNYFGYNINHKQVKNLKESLEKSMLERIIIITKRNELIFKIDHIKPDTSNIEDVYNNNFILWLYQNSHTRKDNSELDKDGFSNNIVNGWINDPSNLEYSKKTKNGFELTEIDFIENEIDFFASADFKNLSIEQMKKYNFYIDFLNTKREGKTERQKTEKKETQKDKLLFEIGLKLATGELDECLTFNKYNECTGKLLSYPELATRFNLDSQHLKCTIGNYNDQSNKSKNLHNNPEIIKKVITHLKSMKKEPKEWFLNEFKI